MKDGLWEISASKGAADALLKHAKLITPDVIRVSEELAARRCQDRDWRKHATVTRRDVVKAICEVQAIPYAEFTICTLAQRIPVLAHKLGDNWMTKDFEPDEFYAGIGVWSSGEKLAAMFLLNVWNPGYAKGKGWNFNVFDAVGTLSADNLLPICEWMLNPEWP